MIHRSTTLCCWAMIAAFACAPAPPPAPAPAPPPEPAPPPAAVETARSESVSATFAESAALMAASGDGANELTVRIARFPGRGAATLWLAAYVGDRGWGLAQEDVELGDTTGPTPVENDLASFTVTGSARARIECRDRHTAAMTCTVSAEGLAHESRDPPLGQGTVPLRVEAEFQARHPGDQARRGRLEIFGTVRATIETPEGTHRLEGLGKYHEQTGERPSFAGPFTYFAVQGDGGSLLARGGGGSTWGFALLDGETVKVETFTIDPLGTPGRAFRVELADGSTIEGTTEIVRQTSVPIEGERRPSATVRVTTDRGPMVGHLNDWKPPG